MTTYLWKSLWVFVAASSFVCLRSAGADDLWLEGFEYPAHGFPYGTSR